jgi:hypothetical protein
MKKVIHNQDDRQRPGTHDEVLAELRAMRLELESQTRRFDEFARTLLNAKFPYGMPTDRWPRV